MPRYSFVCHQSAFFNSLWFISIKKNKSVIWNDEIQSNWDANNFTIPTVTGSIVLRCETKCFCSFMKKEEEEQNERAVAK